MLVIEIPSNPRAVAPERSSPDGNTRYYTLLPFLYPPTLVPTHMRAINFILVSRGVPRYDMAST